MEFDNGFSIILIVTSLTMLFYWWWQTKRPSKYHEGLKMLSKSKRTGRSEEHYNYYIAYSGKLYLKFGIILLAIGITGIFFKIDMILGFMLAISILLVGILFISIKTENALIDKFGK